MVLTSTLRGIFSLMLRATIPRGIFTPSTVGRRLRFTAARPARPTAAPPTITPSAPFAILPAPLPALAATGPTPPLRCWAFLDLEDRFRWTLEARGPAAAAWDPDRLRAELEAAGRLRADDAFELPRAPEFELLRAEPELELRPLELAAVAPLPLAAGRLRLPVFGEPLCFALVCLATSRPLYGSGSEEHVHATSIAAGPVGFRARGLSLRRSSSGCRAARRTALCARGDPPRSPGRAGARHSPRRPAKP